MDIKNNEATNEQKTSLNFIDEIIIEDLKNNKPSLRSTA